MTDMHAVMGALAEAMREERVTKADIARACGISDQAVGKWFKSGRVSKENLMVAARLVGRSLDQLMATGSGFEPPTHVRTQDEPRGIVVPLLNARASMGLGSPMPDHETVVGGLRLSETWCQGHLSTSNPRNLAALTAYGDSMEPTFADGDILLVDRGVLDLKLDAVYVLAYRDELYIKRIQRRPDGRVVVRSDNALYEAFVIDPAENHLSVLGRVVWAWRGKKL